uniref:Cystatin domain-containing protein n=1 Tax=Cyanoderma ruficeps TaxID=181631 RepID=A0A8C3XEB1_9PASS
MSVTRPQLRLCLEFYWPYPSSRNLAGTPAIDNPEKDKGLHQTLQFAVKEHDKASSNGHSNQVIQIIGAKKQVTVGVKYTTKVEISRTTEHTICKFIILSVPWQNQINLLENKCQAINHPKSTPEPHEYYNSTQLLKEDK